MVDKESNRRGVHTDLSHEDPTDRSDSLISLQLRLGLKGGSASLRSRGPGDAPAGRTVTSIIAYAITCVLSGGSAWAGHSLGGSALVTLLVAGIVFLTGVALTYLSMRTPRSTKPQTAVAKRLRRRRSRTLRGPKRKKHTGSRRRRSNR